MALATTIIVLLLWEVHFIQITVHTGNAARRTSSSIRKCQSHHAGRLFHSKSFGLLLLRELALPPTSISTQHRDYQASIFSTYLYAPFFKLTNIRKKTSDEYINFVLKQRQ